MHEMPRLEAPISQTLYCCNYEEHFTRHGEAQHHGKVRGEKPGYDSANDNRILPQDLSTSDEEGSLVNAPHEFLSTGFDCANDGNIPCGIMAHNA